MGGYNEWPMLNAFENTDVLCRTMWEDVVDGYTFLAHSERICLHVVSHLRHTFWLVSGWNWDGFFCVTRVTELLSIQAPNVPAGCGRRSRVTPGTAWWCDDGGLNNTT